MAIVRGAWRNLWRNWRRTAITLAAVSASTCIMILSWALVWGMMGNMKRNMTAVSMGDLQIHARGYLAEKSIYAAVKNPDACMRAAEKAGAKAVKRSYGFGLVSCGMKSAGAVFWGVDPAAERSAFIMASKVSEGVFLGEKSRHGVTLGARLAKSLDAGIGSEIVALVQAADGSLGNEIYTVVGILPRLNDGIDRSGIFIRRPDWEELFVAPGVVHEIAVNGDGKIPLEILVPAMAKPAGRDEVKTWRELMPIIGDWLDMFDVMMFFFSIIFGAAAGLGVMNTMLMATHERTREIGVLKALGATPFRIVRDISMEAFLLGLAGCAIGTLLGVLGGIYLERYGINTALLNPEGLRISGMVFETIWYGKLTIKGVATSGLLMLVICMVSAIYPAIRAARLDPVEAMGRV